MRLITFLFLHLTFTMCKTKDAIPAEDLLNYVVIFQRDETPKSLEEGMSNELVDFSKVEGNTNLWFLGFRGATNDASKIKTELLNHPAVLSAFTKEQYSKLDSSRGPNASQGSSKRKKAAKQ